MSKEQAKALAERHGYKLRRVAASTAYPNGYVKVIAPDGSETKLPDWSYTLLWLQQRIFKSK
ncbi:hypothetical protein Theco_4065 (plasmid) [Thermobacillus composti KWC4]|uniref:Uncharacterized protein n=1 Tax=Thermobacillus composti (strain DSM 18247 / JCM 13945 / KWC4) TaxID=717605 RepID=L0ELA0_THECK|nr:hypothetical protein [Thermobacillus composti]AGA60065.1 hypothetical protein Theco_4065 [Thermobacillus composti KWC4]